MARSSSVAVVCVLLGLWSAAFTPALKRVGARNQSPIQRKADSSGLIPFGPVVTYSKALTDGAQAKGESVLVTKEWGEGRWVN